MSAAMSLEAFARKVLRAPLWPHQVEAAASEKFITVIAAARRTGKSTLAETMAIWTCFSERNVKVLILSATQDASRRLTEGIAATLNEHELTKSAVVDDYSTRIRLDNGSEVISLPASQRQVRGYGKGVRLLVLDECGWMAEELWTAAHYVALDERPQSRILMLGTPWGSSDHFFRRAYEAGIAGDPDHAAFNWQYTANPNLDRGYLERHRERVSPQTYQAEVLGQWGSAEGAMFTHELLHSVTADIDVPALSQLHGPARGIVGCDWGLSYDISAACGIYRLPVAGLNPDREPLPTYVALPWTWPQGHPLHMVVGDLVAAAPNFSHISTEVNGIGGAPSQDLVRLFGEARRNAGARTKYIWNTVTTSAATKTGGYGSLLTMMQRGQLVLPRHPQLLRQLAGVRFEVRARGVMGIDTEDVTHDDCADALYLATLPHRPPGAHRVICELPRLAGGRAAPEEAVPELDCPVVQTGAGLRVYQRPPLQSVSRVPALSLYARPVPPKPQGVQMGRFLIKPSIN